jgi:hypothetical protein
MRLQIGFAVPITEDFAMTGEMKKKQKNENIYRNEKNKESHYCKF